eukprot:jgi/Mesvir1/15340/Mv26324-RA.1
MAKKKTLASRPGLARGPNEPSILTNAMRKRLHLSRLQMTTLSMTTTPAQQPTATPDLLVHPQQRDSLDPPHPDPERLEDNVVPDLNAAARRRQRRRHAILDDASEDEQEDNIDRVNIGGEDEEESEDEPGEEDEGEEEVEEEEEGDEVDEEDPPPRRAKKVKFIDDEAGVSDDDEDSDGEAGASKNENLRCNCCEPPFVAKSQRGLSNHVTCKIKRGREARRHLQEREDAALNEEHNTATQHEEAQETDEFIPLRQPKHARGRTPLKNMTLHISISGGARDLNDDELGKIEAFHVANGGKGMSIVEEGILEMHKHVHMLIDVEATSAHAVKLKLKKELGWGEPIDEKGKHDKTKPSLVARQVKPSHKLNYSGMIGYLLKSEEQEGFQILYCHGIDEDEKEEGRIEYLLHGSPTLKGRCCLTAYNLLERAAVYWFKHHNSISLRPNLIKTMAHMFKTGRYSLDARFLMGRGLDYPRVQAAFEIMVEPRLGEHSLSAIARGLERALFNPRERYFDSDEVDAAFPDARAAQRQERAARTEEPPGSGYFDIDAIIEEVRKPLRDDDELTDEQLLDKVLRDERNKDDPDIMLSSDSDSDIAFHT